MHPNLSSTQSRDSFQVVPMNLIIYFPIKNTVSTFCVWFGINKSHIWFTCQYLYVNNSQSKHVMSVSLRTIFFSSRQNCGLIPARQIYLTVYKETEMMPLDWLLLMHEDCMANQCVSVLSQSMCRMQRQSCWWFNRWCSQTMMINFGFMEVSSKTSI